MHSDASSHRKVQSITVAVVSWQFITSFPVMCKMVAGQSEEMRAKDCGKCPLISAILCNFRLSTALMFWPTNREIETRLFSARFKRKDEMKGVQLSE